MRATLPPIDISKLPRVKIRELREDCPPCFHGTNERAMDRDLRCPKISNDEFMGIVPPDCWESILPIETIEAYTQRTFGKTYQEYKDNIPNEYT